MAIASLENRFLFINLTNFHFIVSIYDAQLKKFSSLAMSIKEFFNKKLQILVFYNEIV